MSNLVEKYGNLPLKKNARTVTSRVAPKTTDHPAYGRIFNAYNTRYVELDGGAITLELARERENAPNYPFADGMRFCSEHTRDSDVIDVIECVSCYRHESVPCTLDSLLVTSVIDPFHTCTPCWHEKSFIQFNIRWYGDGSYDAGNHNGMPCEWTAFGDSAKGGS